MSGLGGYVHEKLLLDRGEADLRGQGFETYRSVSADPGHVDLLAVRAGVRIVVEAEMSSKRVANDLAKAMRLQANELWILTPTVQVARLVGCKLRKLGVTPNTNGVFVLTLPKAKHRLTTCFPLFVGANED